MYSRNFEAWIENRLGRTRIISIVAQTIGDAYDEAKDMAAEGEFVRGVVVPTDDAPYIRYSPDFPALWVLVGETGQQVGQYETREEAETALGNYLAG